MIHESDVEGAAATRPTGSTALVIAYGNFLFRYRNGLFPVTIGTVFFWFPPVFAGGSLARDLWLDLLGALVVVMGLGIRAMVVSLAYIRRGGLNKRVYAEGLVTEGLFSCSRNPIYVGNLLMMLGYLLVHNSPWAYLLGGGFILLSYRAIVAAEEHYLSRTFGAAYQAYCRDVPRWRIRLARLREVLAKSTFNWRRVVIKDYATIMFAIIIVSGLVADEFVFAEGWAASRSVLILVGVVWALAFLGGIVVRVLKKTGRLTAGPS